MAVYKPRGEASGGAGPLALAALAVRPPGSEQLRERPRCGRAVGVASLRWQPPAEGEGRSWTAAARTPSLWAWGGVEMGPRTSSYSRRLKRPYVPWESKAGRCLWGFFSIFIKVFII